VASGKVVGGVLLAADEVAGVVELPVCSSPDLIYDCGLEVDVDSPGDELACPCFREEGLKCLIAVVIVAVAVGGDAVLQAEELPAGVAHLNTALTNVDRDDLSHLIMHNFSLSIINSLFF
jgi:hypothetical protein